MAINYAHMAASAKKMIEANGISCTFFRAGRDPADVTKPWRGPTTSGIATHPPVTYAGVKAVLFPEEYKVGKGEVVRTGFMTLLAAHDSFPGGAVDVRTIDTIDEGSFKWRVVDVFPLMPGVTPLIYQFKLEK